MVDGGGGDGWMDGWMKEGGREVMNGKKQLLNMDDHHCCCLSALYRCLSPHQFRRDIQLQMTNAIRYRIAVRYRFNGRARLADERVSLQRRSSSE